MNFSPSLPSYVDTALARLKDAGVQAYLVGGCVRDLLRGVAPSDYDLAVSSVPEETERAFAGFRVVETGLKHGTVTVVIEGQNLELTTFRLDGGYSDGRHPDDVRFTSRLVEDLSRRDFTVNAMAYAPETGLVDLFGGVEDLQRGVIRCVGDPEKRFTEDALRILRALRFASALDFSIADATEEALFALSGRLRLVSVERQFSELKKLFTGAGAKRVAAAHRDVLGVSLPELAPLSDADWEAGADALPALCDPAAAFAAFLAPLGKDAADALCRRLKTDNAFRERVRFLCEFAPAAFKTPGQARRFKGSCGAPLFGLLLSFSKARFGIEDPVARAVAEEKEAYPTRISDLKINGRDLEALGVKGREVGELLQKLLEDASEGRVKNEKEALLERAKAM